MVHNHSVSVMTIISTQHVHYRSHYVIYLALYIRACMYTLGLTWDGSRHDMLSTCLSHLSTLVACFLLYKALPC